MYYVYILQSAKDGIRYIGSTSKHPSSRAKEHNTNKGVFTKAHQPWQLIYSESYATKSEARKREIFLKSGQGRKWFGNQQRSGVV